MMRVVACRMLRPTSTTTKPRHSAVTAVEKRRGRRASGIPVVVGRKRVDYVSNR